MESKEEPVERLDNDNDQASRAENRFSLSDAVLAGWIRISSMSDEVEVEDSHHRQAGELDKP